jgi:hypothetical protein
MEKDLDVFFIKPLQLIIIEYVYSKCDECNILLKEEEYKCYNCGITRCKFHQYVCAIQEYCISCDAHNLHNTSKTSYYYLYDCVACNNHAYFYHNNIWFCFIHRPLAKDVIRFDEYCEIECKKCEEQYDVELCCGVGYFRHKSTKQSLCIKHKKDYNKNDIEYNYIN